MAHKKHFLWAVLLVVFLGLFVVFAVDMVRGSGAKRLNIAVVMKTNNFRSDYWQMVSSGAKAAAKEFDVHIDITGPLSETDAEDQIRSLNEVLAQKPDAVVLAAVDGVKLEASVDKIKSSGAKLILLDLPIPGHEAESLVATDHIEAGKKIAETLVGPHRIEQMKVLALSDKNGSSAEKDREKGFHETLASFGNVDNVGTYFFDGTEDAAYVLVDSLMAQHPDIHGIAGLNEKATLGAARALKEKKQTDLVSLVGFDSSIYQVKLLEEGRLKATVVQRPFNIGYLSLETAVKVLRGIKVAPRMNIDALVITKDNMYTQQNQELLFPLVEK